jgi:cell pole-organizing protein PopZ
LPTDLTFIRTFDKLVLTLEELEKMPKEVTEEMLPPDLKEWIEEFLKSLDDQKKQKLNLVIVLL